ncbi:MAG: GYDIA family GHMP kinase [Bacteroidota bacterium]
MNNYYSNGKLLISGEYLVMDGALALAVPVKYGQGLKIEESSAAKIFWQTNVIGELWFKAEFDNHFNIKTSSNFEIANYLSKLLLAAQRLNPEFVGDFGYNVLTEIDFDINWGLGSSSTLISNVAGWAGVDPFQLFWLVANGSGYDIACAQSEKPIMYELNAGRSVYRNVDFLPEFREHIYFAYLGQKQDSEKSILKFKQKAEFSEIDIHSISEISKAFIDTDNITEFGKLMLEHERIIGNILDKTPVKKTLFNNFEGEIKSLGAWGGDFIMIASKLPIENIKNYFSGKGINILFSFDEIVLS